MTGILTAARCSRAAATSPPKRPCSLDHRGQALHLSADPLGRRHWGLVTPAQLCWGPLARAVTVARGGDLNYELGGAPGAHGRERTATADTQSQHEIAPSVSTYRRCEHTPAKQQEIAILMWDERSATADTQSQYESAPSVSTWVAAQSHYTLVSETRV